MDGYGKEKMTLLELQVRQAETQSIDKNTEKFLREYRCHDIY